MKFSIITATLNSEKTIIKTLNSVLSQNGINELFELEYIIIDDDSKDDTINIIKSFEPAFKEKGIVFKWISEKDRGIYNAWNKGLKLATGDWMAFLGSDDIYLDGALEKYANVVKLNPQVDFIHSKIKIYKQTSFIRDIKKQWHWNLFKKSMNIAHVGAFHNKNYFKKYGGFNENYRIAGDYEMLLRAKHELKAVFTDNFTVIMQEGGISSKMFLKSFKEAEKAKQLTAGVGFISSKRYSLNLLIRYFGGKLLRKLKIR